MNDPHEAAHAEFWSTIHGSARDRTLALIDRHSGDIDSDCLAFLGVYHPLSLLIPQHWTVVDLGCCYAFQSWFFRDHARYVGVDLLPVSSRLVLPNAVHVEADIGTWIQELGYDGDDCFAILSYVPLKVPVQAAVRGRFKNLFVYYPDMKPLHDLIKKLQNERKL